MKIFAKIRNSIKLKIIMIHALSFLIVYIVTWWVLSIYLFQPQEKEREQNMLYNAEKIVGSIRNRCESYDNIILRLSNNRIIYKSLCDQYRNYEKVWTALTSIKYTLNEDMARDSTIKSLQVYQHGSDIGEDGRYVFCKGYDSERPNNSDWLNESIDGKFMLYKYHKISSLYNDVQAYIKIAIDCQEAFGEVMDLDQDMSGTVYLTNEADMVIASPEENSIGTSIRDIIPGRQSDLSEGKIKEYNKIMIIKSVVDEKWNIWLLASSKQFTSQVNHSKLIVGMILLSFGICTEIALSLILSKVFTRLHKIGDKMEKINGDISYINIPEHYDEVTVLEVKYNSMLNQLETTIREMAEVNSQKQKFEFKSLESQINPHFLYNTLGVMRWEAMESQNEKLVNMIDDLTTFYRLSLNKGRGLLSVEQELKLVKAYINIQQMRWDNVVDVDIYMDTQVKDVIIPKMILQPLVENIWLHGNIIAQGNRKIRISVHDAGSYVVLTIYDNGDGISQEALKKLNSDEEAEGDSFGIGIHFIRNILKFYYKDNFVYEVTSEMSSGTVVRIELPKEIGVKK